MRVRKMWFVVLAVLLTALVGAGLWAGAARAQTPAQQPAAGTTLPYPGHLTGSDGQPVADGTYAFTFALYGAAAGGDSLWSETQEGVAVQGGAFLVSLGSAVPIPTSVLKSSALWLEVAVRGPAETSFTMLSPRQQLSAVSPQASTPQQGSPCPHSHFADVWNGNQAIAGLVVDNAGTGDGIRAYSHATASNFAAVYGVNFGTGTGVYGQSDNGRGVYGGGDWAVGVWGESTHLSALYGHSVDGLGLSVTCDSADIIRAFGANGGDIEFKVTNDGNVYADGAYLSPAADMAEMLPAASGLEPGDVLVVGSDGNLARSTRPYEAAVVGVYSTKPAFVGGAADDADLTGQVPLAVVGVVPVKVSAENGPIHPGDLLVSSSTPGYAMKAGPNPPQGTVIGKALAGLATGTGVIQMLVTLQ